MDPSANPIALVTSNPNKVVEAERILGIPLLRVSLALPEIQAAAVEDVTRHKLEAARALGYARIVVEDVSLGFEALGGFPGPHIHWLLNAAGGEGLGVIARGLENRSARARCCVGYWDGGRAFVFVGETRGEILTEPRGAKNFGWDPWFLPAGSARSFGEMDEREKDAVSHRGSAYRLLAAHLGRNG